VGLPLTFKYLDNRLADQEWHSTISSSSRIWPSVIRFGESVKKCYRRKMDLRRELNLPQLRSTGRMTKITFSHGEAFRQILEDEAAGFNAGRTRSGDY